MNSAKQTWGKMKNSKNIKELLVNTPWIVIEWLAAIPALIFIFAEIRNLFDLLFFYDYLYDYFYDMKKYTYIAGAIIYIVYFSKRMVDKDNKRAEKNNTMIFFSLFALGMLLSTFVNGFTKYALHGIVYHSEDIWVYMSYPLIYYFSCSLIQNQTIKKVICYSFLFNSFLVAIFSLISHYQQINGMKLILNYSEQTDHDLVGFFRNTNHYAYYLVICILLSCILFLLEQGIIIRIFLFLNYTINIYVLILNDTLGGYLACVVGLAVLILVPGIFNQRWNRLSIFMVLVFLIETFISSFFYDTVMSSLINLFYDLKNISENNEDADHAGSGRFKLWKYTIKYIFQKPFLGWGNEGVAEKLTKNCNMSRTHNEFLEYIAFFGIPAGCAYIAGCCSAFWKGIKKSAKWGRYTLAALFAAFGYFTSSFVGVSMYYTAPLFFIFLGLGTDSGIEE